MRFYSAGIFFLFGLFISSCGVVTNLEDRAFYKKLGASGSDSFERVLSRDGSGYRLQMVYTSVNRKKSGLPVCRSYFYRTRQNQYLYPASLVKLPLSLVALEKLNRLKTQNGCNINRATPIVFDSAYICQQKLGIDADTPSIDAFIRKMMLVSDNVSYNRTYEFTGYDDLGIALKSKGFEGMRIVHRFSQQCDSLSNYITNPFAFVNGKDTVCRNPMQKAKKRFVNPRGRVFMGKGYMSDVLINEPKEFTYRNNAPLEEMHRLMLGLFVPETQSAGALWNIPDDDLNALKKYMGMWPSESQNPVYPLPKNFKKYIFMGTNSSMPMGSDIRIFNVVGRAYGVLADCAYVVDFNSGAEFFVSAIMYCNERDILNTDDYQYHNVGLPFMTELGRLIYEREKQKATKHNKAQVQKLKMLFNR